MIAHDAGGGCAGTASYCASIDQQITAAVASYLRNPPRPATPPARPAVGHGPSTRTHVNDGISPVVQNWMQHVPLPGYNANLCSRVGGGYCNSEYFPVTCVGCQTALQFVQQASGYDDLMACKQGSVSGCAWTAAALLPFIGKAGDEAAIAVRTTDLFGTSARGVWDLSPFARGFRLEKELGGNLAPGFPTVDVFTGSQVESIKSIDLAAQSYQRASNLSRVLTRYIDKVSAFQGARWGGTEIEASEIQARALTVAIPNTATADQLNAMYNAIQYGLSRPNPVTVKFEIFAG